MNRFCALFVSLFLCSCLLACPGKDMSGVPGADVIAEGKFVSAVKTDLKKHGRPVYIYEIEVNESFYGEVSTKEPIKIMMLPFEKREAFEKGEDCLICLRVLLVDDDPGTKCKWPFSRLTRSSSRMQRSPLPTARPSQAAQWTGTR
jgi:hypothetical protein